MWNRYLDFVINPRLQGVYILFVLSFKNDDVREIHKQYYLPTVETKDYNVMIKEDISLISQNKTKKRFKIYNIIRKIATSQGNGYKTGCLLDYPYFKK